MGRKNTMRFAAGAMAGLMAAGTVSAAVPYNVLADEVTMEWREENGVKYWYENGVKQGTEGRGKEIYDPGSDAWYWLDAVDGGKMAVSKDVYQESGAGQWGDKVSESGERIGKWVRYDENGHMVKGWDTTEAGTYYFDLIYGTMAKGDAVIDGVSYHFNEVTGVAESGGARDDDGKLLLADGWHKVDGVNYWYENGVRQGVKYNEDGSIDTSYRGKEIYDPGSDAWYWLDCVQNGAVAKDKDVYQESGAGQWGESTNENGERVGKWVRYDADGHMVKGWAEKDGAKYYFDPVYGTMAKGTVSIDGKSYEFGSADGKLVREVVDDNNGSNNDNNNTEDNDNKDNNTGDKDDNKNDESTQAALSDCTVTLSQDIYEGDGTEKKPEVTVKNGDEVIPSSEYTVTYSDNVNAGTATVTITANNDSSMVSGSVTKTFTITEKAQEDNFEWNISDDGKLTVTGSCSGKLYTIGTDIFGYTRLVYPWDEYKDQIKSAYINVTGLTAMSYMFSDCENLSSVDVSDLDTSNVKYMGHMFYNCKNLSSVDVSGFDTSKVTNMSYMFSGCSNLSSVDVSGFDTSKVTNMSYMFSGCSNLSSVDVSGFDTSKVTNMSYMFSGCSNLSSVDVSGFDTSNVTNMAGMFYECNNLSNVDVSGFDTSNVTTMSGMFSYCIELSSVDVSGFDTSNVTNMSQMFSACGGLSSVDVSGFDTSKVRDMSWMFSGCSNLSSVDVSGFDTSNVTNMRDMFSGYNGLSSLDLSSFDTSKVTDMSWMFSGYKLSSLDLSSFDTSNVTDMSAMFANCIGLTSLDLSSFNAGSVTDMSGMFGECRKLTEVIVGSDWNAPKREMTIDGWNIANSNVDTVGMFSYCGTDHVTVRQYNKDNNTGDKDDNKNDESTQAALSDCTVTLSQDSYESDGTEKKPEVTVKNGDEVIPSSEYTVTYSKNVNAGRATVTITANNDSSMVSGSITKAFTITKKEKNGNIEWSVSYDGKLTVTGSCSGTIGCPWFDYRNLIDSAYINVTGLTDMSYMFDGCRNLTSVDLSDLDTSQVTDMSYMFEGCRNLTSVDLSGIDTSNVTTMQEMFYECDNLSSVDLNGIDTSNVTDMKNMFSKCYKLSSVNLSGIDTSNVTNMRSMFDYCNNLTSVDLSSFDTGKVTDMSSMFSNCEKLTEIIVGSGWDTSNAYTGYMFSDCGTDHVTVK